MAFSDPALLALLFLFRLKQISARYVELSDCRSVAEVQEAVRKHAEDNQDLPWVVRLSAARGALCDVSAKKMGSDEDSEVVPSAAPPRAPVTRRPFRSRQKLKRKKNAPHLFV